ncbi:MAG: hypothetical protein JSS40_02890 [Proteobacteria bacterium]|nr:hypothetical protein [Pseudomonadota bacterium]
MTRNRPRQNGMRAAIAAAAARIMAEGGTDNFALAKRKAARQLGATDKQALPGNEEIEAELRAYLELYQADEHPDRIRELRRIALSMMRELAEFTPYLTGPVLKGIAGPYSDIELQLFPDSGKDVEIFLLNRNIQFSSTEARRYSGDRARSVTVLELDWEGVPVKLSLFDSRDERITLKTTQIGKVMDRAGIPEVSAMVQGAGG